jgi:hypothetical protein
VILKAIIRREKNNPKLDVGFEGAVDRRKASKEKVKD